MDLLSLKNVKKRNELCCGKAKIDTHLKENEPEVCGGSPV